MAQGKADGEPAAASGGPRPVGSGPATADAEAVADRLADHLARRGHPERPPNKHRPDQVADDV